jgi:hypothetical protein
MENAIAHQRTIIKVQKQEKVLTKMVNFISWPSPFQVLKIFGAYTIITNNVIQHLLEKYAGAMSQSVDYSKVKVVKIVLYWKIVVQGDNGLAGESRACRWPLAGWLLSVMSDTWPVTSELLVPPPPPGGGGGGQLCPSPATKQWPKLWGPGFNERIQVNGLFSYLMKTWVGLNKNRKIRTKSKQISLEAPSSVKVVKVKV